MFQIMSDIHLEADGELLGLPIEKALQWVDSVPQTADIMILAGDIHNKKIRQVLGAFTKRWRLVLHVPGNHEYWGQRFKYQWDRFNRTEQEFSNVHILREEIYQDSVTGLRFAGTTLWFPYCETTISKQNLMNDFTRIKESAQLFRHNARSVKFLRDSVFDNDLADIVITHYAPTEKSIPEKYKDDTANPFYYTPLLDNQYLECKAKLWIHGHMHHVNDYIHPYGVRIVSNTGGYSRDIPGFDPGRIYSI